MYLCNLFRYRRIESDEDECMESNFAQQMKEERISTKIGKKHYTLIMTTCCSRWMILGILEDLEEERLQREEEERKKKMLKKKAKTRK